jgi:hypothetical protein
LLNQSSAGYKRKRTKFPILLSSEIIPLKRFKEKRAAAKREIFKKFQQEFQKACQDNPFFSLCCINWCVGLHLCKTSILLQRSRERNSCQSENVVGPGDTETGVSQEVTTNRIKGKIWIARHRRVPPWAGREPLLSGYTRLIQISDLSSMFLLPGIRKCKWGYTQHSYHAEFVSRKLPVQRITAYSLCIFNPSALNVARKSAISRHQKWSIFQLLNFLPRPFNSNDRRGSLYMARDGRALLCICMLSVSDGRCSLI